VNDGKPFAMSAVDVVLARHGLRWELYPYRIVVDGHPHIIVQAGPQFDLRESALKGTRERALTAERKRRQRKRLSTPKMSRSDGQTELYNPSIERHSMILPAKNSPAI
jgi:hypothetical protein